MKILVTGAAGFIGYHTTRALLARGDEVVGFDVINDYYDPLLKEARLTEISKGNNAKNFNFIRADLTDQHAVDSCFSCHKFDRVIHLAAQAGVRYSLINPRAYVRSNIDAFVNILEACRHAQTPHLTYASTSSVYGANTNLPFSEEQATVHPLQFYAATKRANELMAHSYSHLFGLPTTGLRFFTVYGPWGRPDMALFLFTKNILAGKPISVFNYGKHTRDFTYVEDIVQGIIKTSDSPAKPNPLWNSQNPDPATSNAPWRIFNIGNNNPVTLDLYINAIENVLSKKAIQELMPLQAGDVPNTYASIEKIQRETDYAPNTSVDIGVRKFVEWYCQFYKAD